ncbi:WxL protein peptidoglycan domain-containing protein [Aquipuribacter sp. MA13-6]|uniref:WxL protein peptidoglycan domain-containing protein n=1 Tax=unclassified Aquipuribacter TaxID=2635084 RepID=UPI003EE98A89
MEVSASVRGGRVVAAMTGLLAAALLVVPAASASTAAGEDTAFVLLPSKGSSLAESGGYFVLAADEGQTVTQSVDLRNDQDVPLKLELTALDAGTAEVGGVSFPAPGEAVSATGTWITIEQPSVTLAPGEATTVDFRVVVPDQVEAGTHLAGLSVSPPPAPQLAVTAGEDQAGAELAVRTRRVIAVQVDVGSAPAELLITGTDPLARPDGLHVGIGVENTGGTLLTETNGTLSIPGLDVEHDFAVGTFVPGTAIAYPIPVEGTVAIGEYPVNVHIDYADGQVVTFDGLFTVAPEVAAALAEAAGETPGGMDLAASGLVGIVIAVVMGAALAVLLLLLVAVLIRRRTPRGRRSAVSPSASGRRSGRSPAPLAR